MARAFQVLFLGCFAVLGGCSTVPKTAAIQTTAVGGGFVAAGAVTTTFAVLGGGVGLMSASQVERNDGVECGPTCPNPTRDAAVSTVFLSAGGAAAVGAAELLLGAYLLNRGGNALDEAERAE